MSLPQEKSFLDETDYLNIERQALERSEYYQGECFAMAGASRTHNTLSANTLTLLNIHLRERPCQVPSAHRCWHP